MSKMLEMRDMTEVSDIKRKFDKELIEEEIKQKELLEELLKIKRDHESKKAHVEAKKERVFKLRINFIDMKLKIESNDEPIRRIVAIINDYKQKVAADLDMRDFEESIKELKNTYIQTIAYYSDDRLTLELSNKAKVLNDKRCLITKMDDTIAMKKQEIERRKAEVEIIKEKKRQEEAAIQAKLKDELNKRQMAEKFNMKLNDSSIVSERPFARPLTPRCENHTIFPRKSHPPSPLTIDVKMDDEPTFSQMFDYKKYM